MKKKILITYVVLVWVACGAYLLLGKEKGSSQNASVTPKHTSQNVLPSQKTQKPPQPTFKQKETTSVFVPYWAMPDSSLKNQYDSLYYFGVTADTNGIIKDDAGYENLEKFAATQNGLPTYLTLRMLDTDTNIAILRSEAAQEKVIQQTLDTAKANNFKGVVLDLELSVLPFDEVKQNVNAFVEKFYRISKAQNMTFMMTIYGDVFYRKRPYDMQFLNNNTDQFLIMAYDLHKSNGQPGPNFPLSGKEKYGYDMHTLIADLKNVVPSEKVTIIFGMFGYDWTVSLEGVAYGQAKPLSLNEITAKYITSCDWQKCTVKREDDAKEAVINFVDSTTAQYLIYHKVWFEDQKSVEEKKAFLKENGILSTAYWAYGNF
jgi:spore germination protein YaaH